MNLPEVVSNFPAPRRRESMVHLEVCSSLRRRPLRRGFKLPLDARRWLIFEQRSCASTLRYFYASAVDSEDQRKNYKTEDDLVRLDDWALIRGCRQIGVLSELGFKHLDDIRDMRNWASAAHPNHTELTGLQLCAWLETCIREVLIKEPEGPGVEVRTLLYNLRNEPLTVEDIPAIDAALSAFQEKSHSLLRTVFGDVGRPKN